MNIKSLILTSNNGTFQDAPIDGQVYARQDGSWVVVDSSIVVVANYSALPSASTVSGSFYWCSNSQGTAWLPGSLGGTYYPKGLYYSNGVSWEYLETPYQATQGEVNTGTNNDKFVTPLTLANSSFLNGKLNIDGSNAMTGNLDVGGNDINNVANINLAGGNIDLNNGQLNQVAYLNLVAGGGISEDGNTHTMPSSSGQLINDTSLATALGNYQSKPIVISSNHNAVLDEVYRNVASATYTDPTPTEGKAFTVLVINGTATVGGTGYSTAGTKIIRRYHSGSWANLIFLDKAQNDALYLSLGGGTLTGPLTAPSFTVNGTGGAGFVSINTQSSQPSAVVNTVRLFLNSSGQFSWVRRNNANSADIRRTLIMPDQDIDYTFPTPSTGSASTLAGLNTAQTWTQQQTFSAVPVPSGSNSIQIGSASNVWSNIWTNKIKFTTTIGMVFKPDDSTGSGTHVAFDIGSANVGTGGTTSVSADLRLSTGSHLNTGAASYSSGNILFEIGSIGGSSTGTRGNISFFGGLTSNLPSAPNFQSMQRGIYIGNATAVPTGNPSGGGFLYSEGGALKWRGSSGTITTLGAA